MLKIPDSTKEKHFPIVQLMNIEGRLQIFKFEHFILIAVYAFYSLNNVENRLLY